MKLFLSLLLVSTVTAGCFRTAAKTTPDGPPLDVPAAEFPRHSAPPRA
jgi:hypothetical protein